MKLHLAAAHERAAPGAQAPAAAEVDRIFRNMVARGAKRVPMSEIRQNALAAPGEGAAPLHTCGAVTCWCEGALNCADMISSCGGDDFHCLPGPDGPVVRSMRSAAPRWRYERLLAVLAVLKGRISLLEARWNAGVKSGDLSFKRQATWGMAAKVSVSFSLRGKRNMKQLLSASVFAVVSSVTAASAAEFSFLSSLSLTTTSVSTSSSVLFDWNDTTSDFSSAIGNASATATATVPPVFAGVGMLATGSGMAVGPMFSSAWSVGDAGYFVELTTSSNSADDARIGFLLVYELLATASGLAGETAFAFAGLDLFVNGTRLFDEAVEVHLLDGAPLSDMLSGSFSFSVVIPGFDGTSNIGVLAYGGGRAEVTPVPLPAGGALLLAALAGMAALRRRAAR